MITVHSPSWSLFTRHRGHCSLAIVITRHRGHCSLAIRVVVRSLAIRVVVRSLAIVVAVRSLATRVVVRSLAIRVVVRSLAIRVVVRSLVLEKNQHSGLKCFEHKWDLAEGVHFSLRTFFTHTFSLSAFLCGNLNNIKATNVNHES